MQTRALGEPAGLEVGPGEGGDGAGAFGAAREDGGQTSEDRRRRGIVAGLDMVGGPREEPAVAGGVVFLGCEADRMLGEDSRGGTGATCPNGGRFPFEHGGGRPIRACRRQGEVERVLLARRHRRGELAMEELALLRSDPVVGRGGEQGV